MQIIQDFLLAESITVPAATETVDIAEIRSVSLPSNSRVISAQFGEAGEITLAVVVNTLVQKSGTHHFVIAGNGQALPDRICINKVTHPASTEYFTSVQQRPGGPAFHIFRIAPAR